jgi:hypothetical protein
MTDSPSQLARVAATLLFGLVVAGIAWYGISAEELDRLWRNITARPGGPMTFRFMLQPAMAAIAALRDGIGDARLGRLPYAATIIRDSQERGGLLWEGIVSTARILILGVVMDVAYQWFFFRHVPSNRGCGDRNFARIRSVCSSAWPHQAGRAPLDCTTATPLIGLAVRR